MTFLRTKTKESLQGLTRHPKFVLFNNKPVAVLMDFDEYEALTKKGLQELAFDELTPEIIEKANKAKKAPRGEFYNL